MLAVLRSRGAQEKKARKKYIAEIKSLVAEAREVYQSWCAGDTTRRMPAGMFAPRMPVLANLIVLG